MRWYFTDSNGYIRKKSNDKTTIENLLNKFIGESLSKKNSSGSSSPKNNREDPLHIVATHISQNEMKPLNKSFAISIIAGGGLDNSDAIQIFVKPRGEISSRIIVEIKKVDGKFLYSCHKTYMKDETRITISINGNKHQNLCNQAIETIEKNSGHKICKIVFCLLEDENCKT